jgi:hypothetical protein
MAKPTKNSRGSFAKAIPKASKRRTGRTATEETPLALRTSGLALSPVERERVRARAGAKLGKFALHIERATVRFDDVNGPKGGPSLRCRIKVKLNVGGMGAALEDSQQLEGAGHRGQPGSTRAIEVLTCHVRAPVTGWRTRSRGGEGSTEPMTGCGRG